MRVVIVGGGAALAQPLTKHWLDGGSQVTAVVRRRPPIYKSPALVEVKERDLPAAEGRYDLLVTLAGSHDDAPLAGMTTEQWDKVIEDCLTSAFRALRLLLPRVVAGGNVIVVGSVVGSTGGLGCANYAAAKAGLVGLVRAAANEYPRLHINLLELGYVDAGMGARLPEKVKEKVRASIPLGRFATEEDVVLAVEFLARTKYMTGGILTLGGGLR